MTLKAVGKDVVYKVIIEFKGMICATLSIEHISLVGEHEGRLLAMFRRAMNLRLTSS